MNADNTSELFDIKLTAEGIRYIRKFIAIVKLLMIIGILISTVSIFIGLYSQLTRRFDYPGWSYWTRLYLKSYPFYQFAHAILFLGQLYFYWKFRQSLGFAIRYQNEISFNQSFLFIYKNAIWACLSVGLALLFSVFDLIYMLSF